MLVLLLRPWKALGPGPVKVQPRPLCHPRRLLFVLVFLFPIFLVAFVFLLTDGSIPARHVRREQMEPDAGLDRSCVGVEDWCGDIMSTGEAATWKKKSRMARKRLSKKMRDAEKDSDKKE